MSSDEAYVRSELRRLACDCGVRINDATTKGQLSRVVHLNEARASLLRAVEANKDERQLTLEPINETPDANG